MKIERLWAMSSKHTFTIKPIRELLERYVPEDNFWVDPFCGFYSPALHRNDLNPKVPCDSHKEANEYLAIHSHPIFEGALFDPPYSPRQVRESYDNIGIEKCNTKSNFYADVKNKLAELIIPGGKCISFGWNSGGLGKNRGFEIIEILLVPHGGAKNDTIVTVEINTK